MKRSEWYDLLGIWAAIWPNRPLPPESSEAWLALLADLDPVDVRSALLAHAATSEWPPNSPAELRDLASPATSWEEALGRLATAIRQVGSYQPRPTFDDDPALDAVVRSYGPWRSLCGRFDATDSTTRAQFRDAYRDAAKRTRRDRALALATSAGPALAGPSRPELQ